MIGYRSVIPYWPYHHPLERNFKPLPNDENCSEFHWSKPIVKTKRFLLMSIGDESREKFTFQSVRRLQYSAKLQEKKLRNNILSVTYRFDKMRFHEKMTT